MQRLVLHMLVKGVVDIFPFLSKTKGVADSYLSQMKTLTKQWCLGPNEQYYRIGKVFCMCTVHTNWVTYFMSHWASLARLAYKDRLSVIIVQINVMFAYTHLEKITLTQNTKSNKQTKKRMRFFLVLTVFIFFEKKKKLTMKCEWICLKKSKCNKSNNHKTWLMSQGFSTFIMFFNQSATYSSALIHPARKQSQNMTAEHFHTSIRARW